MYVEKIETPTKNKTLYDVKHTETQEYEAGMSFVDFGSRKSFERMLRILDLNGNYKRVSIEEGFLYTWSNKNILIVTTNNPISGKYKKPDERRKDIGFAGFVGIEGKRENVHETVDIILEMSDYYKEVTYGEREYV